MNDLRIDVRFSRNSCDGSKERKPGGMLRFPLRNFASSLRTLRLTDQSSRRDRKGCVRASGDRKSTRLNSSHRVNSYAVFCLKKKNLGPREQWSRFLFKHYRGRYF